jgi:CheY-like chemotaxis protein
MSNDYSMMHLDILLVDDERDILDLGMAALRGAGYSVQQAISGDIAFLLIQQGLLFNLLVTDIVMPGQLDGFGLAKKVREVIPAMPIVYSTGFARAADMRTKDAPDGCLLIKPWRQRDLLAAVGSAMSLQH